MTEKKESFLRNHADTLAIMGLNICIAAVLMTMWVSQSSRIDGANARIDCIYVMFYDLLKEVKK